MTCGYAASGHISVCVPSCCHSSLNEEFQYLSDQMFLTLCTIDLLTGKLGAPWAGTKVSRSPVTGYTPRVYTQGRRDRMPSDGYSPFLKIQMSDKWHAPRTFQAQKPLKFKFCGPDLRKNRPYK